MHGRPLQVLLHQPRGAAAGQDDRAGAQQVQRALGEGGRDPRAPQLPPRQRAHVLTWKSA